MSVEKTPSGRYRVRVSSRGKTVTSRTFDRKKDADAFDRAQRDAIAAGTWVDPSRGQMTVEELAAAFLATKTHQTATYRGSLESTINRHVLPHLGRRPISSVSPSDMDAWVSGLLRDHSVHTARAAAGAMRQMMALAVRDGWVSRSPLQHVRLPQQPRTDPQPLTVVELERLADQTMTHRDRLMILVMGYGGLRFGEVAALRARRVTGDRLRLTESVTHPRGGASWSDLKTHQARTVALPPSVGAELRVYVERMDPETLVFGSSAGTPLRGGNWAKNLARAAVLAGLHRVRAHDLRDTAASLAIDAGASVVVVARMLGHQDASVTLRHYANLFPDDLDDVASRLDALRRSNDATMTRVGPAGVEK